MTQTDEIRQVQEAARSVRQNTGHVIVGKEGVTDLLMVALLDSYCGLTMAGTAENLAREHGIGREQQDLYALRSQQAADAAWKAGKRIFSLRRRAAFVLRP